jgi:hypothetical protein
MRPKPQLVGVQYRIPQEVKDWLKSEAENHDRSINWLVIRVFSDAMKAAKGDAQAGESARASVQPPATS